MPIIAPPSSPVDVQDIEDRLNQLLPVSAPELTKMLTAALAEYVQYVGPLPGSVTEKHDGGGQVIVLDSPTATAITAASYTNGTTIDVASLDLNTRTGIVGWNYGTTGYFTLGSRNVSITYTVGSLPANHAETIIADVAGYFAATQQSGGSFAPSFAGEGYAEPFDNQSPGAPIVLFPRIRSLAPPRVG